MPASLCWLYAARYLLLAGTSASDELSVAHFFLTMPITGCMLLLHSVWLVDCGWSHVASCLPWLFVTCLLPAVSILEECTIICSMGPWFNSIKQLVWRV